MSEQAVGLPGMSRWQNRNSLHGSQRAIGLSGHHRQVVGARSATALQAPWAGDLRLTACLFITPAPSLAQRFGNDSARAKGEYNSCVMFSRLLLRRLGLLLGLLGMLLGRLGCYWAAWGWSWDLDFDVFKFC